MKIVNNSVQSIYQIKKPSNQAVEKNKHTEETQHPSSCQDTNQGGRLGQNEYNQAFIRQLDALKNESDSRKVSFGIPSENQLNRSDFDPEQNQVDAEKTEGLEPKETNEDQVVSQTSNSIPRVGDSGAQEETYEDDTEHQQQNLAESGEGSVDGDSGQGSTEERLKKFKCKACNIYYFKWELYGNFCPAGHNIDWYS